MALSSESGLTPKISNGSNFCKRFSVPKLMDMKYKDVLGVSNMTCKAHLPQHLLIICSARNDPAGEEMQSEACVPMDLLWGGNGPKPGSLASQKPKDLMPLHVSDLNSLPAKSCHSSLAHPPDTCACVCMQALAYWRDWLQADGGEHMPDSPVRGSIPLSESCWKERGPDARQLSHSMNQQISRFPCVKRPLFNLHYEPAFLNLKRPPISHKDSKTI